MAIAPDFLSFGIESASEFWNASIKAIDSKAGAGYAEAHPEILAAFMQVAALTSHSRLIGQLESKRRR